MKVLNKSSCILFYSVNPEYFKRFDEVYCHKSGRSYWATSEADSYTFTYTTSFQAKDKSNDELFLECKARLTCRVLIEDPKQDALQIFGFIKELHDYMRAFISDNSLSYFSKLDLPEYQISDIGLVNMQKNIDGLKDLIKFEDKPEALKRLEEETRNREIKTQFVTIKKS